MKTLVNSIYHKFHCLGAACPNTCCKNWNITVDPDTYEAYRSVKGWEGLGLRLRTRKLRGLRVIQNRWDGSCPYHKEGLCAFQRDEHMERMPQICQLYPRRILEMGDVREVTFELTCIEAARIFLEHPGRLHFQEHTELPAQWVLENDDPEFLSYLFREREKLLDYLWRREEMPNPASQEDLISDMQHMYDYIYESHRRLMRDQRTELFQEDMEIEKFPVKNLTREFRKLLFYPVSIMNDVIYQHLWYTMIPVRNPYLHRAMKAYDHQFGNVSEVRADAYFQRKMKDMLKAFPQLERTYRSYLSFLLQELFMEAYEDYYLLGHLLLAYLYVQSIMILDLAEYLEYGELTLEMQCEILSGTEKGMRHSLDSEQQFLEKIRTDFMNSH